MSAEKDPIENSFRAGWRAANMYSQLVRSGETDERSDEALEKAAQSYLTKKGKAKAKSGQIDPLKWVIDKIIDLITD